MEMRKEREMDTYMQTLLNRIAYDFKMRDPSRTEVKSAFEESLAVEEGRKYLKITKRLGTQTFVWGFVMKDDDKKFKKGDILKAASWASPARNKARGNIFGEYDIRWTGPEYL